MKQQRRKMKKTFWKWLIRITGKGTLTVTLVMAIFLIGFVEGIILGIKDAQGKTTRENSCNLPTRRTVVVYKGAAKRRIGNG